jgi:hypothetical protein
LWVLLVQYLLFAVVGAIALGFWFLRPRHSLKARAQERFRRDRKASRERERMAKRLD